MTQQVPEDAAPLGAQAVPPTIARSSPPGGSTGASPGTAAAPVTPTPRKPHTSALAPRTEAEVPENSVVQKPALPETSPPLPFQAPSTAFPVLPGQGQAPPSVGGPEAFTPKIEAESVTVPRNLELTVSAPSRKQVGAQATYRLTLRNTGDQPAEGVTVHCEFDAGLTFPGSEEREVKQNLGRLLPQESKELALSLTSKDIGSHCSRFSVHVDGEDQAAATESACVNFVAPQLAIDLRGPAQRTVGSRVEFNIEVANHSDEPLSDVQIAATFDAALVPREANSDAELSPGKVLWNLGRLKPHEGVQLQVEFECSTPAHRACLLMETVGPEAAGEQVEGCVEIIAVPGILDLRVSDRNDPLVAGQNGTYEITVQNIGLQAARDLVLEVLPGENLRVLSAEVLRKGEPLKLPYRLVEGHVVFDPVDELPPDALLIFTLEAKALDAGHVELQALLRSPLSQTPVSTTETSTILPE